MTAAAKSPYAGYRFPGEVISHAVWLYFRFPLSLRMVEEMLAARGIDVSHETVRQWARQFGQSFANQIRRKPAWCTDQGCGRTAPTPSGSGDADVLRAAQVQHAIEHVDSDVHLGRPTLLRMRAQPVAEHLLPSRDGG